MKISISPRRIGSALLPVVMVAVLAVSCGSNERSSSDEIGMPMDRQSSLEAPVVYDGSSKLDSTKRDNLGSEDNPVPVEWIFGPTLQMSAGVLRIHTENLCATPWISARLEEFSYRGTTGRSALIWAYHPDMPFVYQGGSYQNLLICAQSTVGIWPNTQGPGGNGMSLSCPSNSISVTRGTGGAFFSYKDGSRASNVSQVRGGYGTGTDGLWNYKFHNYNSSGDVFATIWALC